MVACYGGSQRSEASSITAKAVGYKDKDVVAANRLKLVLIKGTNPAKLSSMTAKGQQSQVARDWVAGGRSVALEMLRRA
jgi:hypothetical protein